MKRRREKLGLLLLAACYVAGTFVLLVGHLTGFAANRAAYAGGTLATARLTVDDFELENLVRVGDDLVSTGGDPQLILRDKERLVASLVLEIHYSTPPLVETVYWAEPGQDYDIRKVAYPAERGSDRFLLPFTGVRGLRIDPGVVAGNTITIDAILINQPRPFRDFFRFSAGETLALAVVPGLVACGLWLVMGLRLPRGKAGEAL